MAKSGGTGRDKQNNQGTAEYLADIQKAEQALKDAKKRSKHC